MQTKPNKNLRLLTSFLLFAGALASTAAQAEVNFNLGLKRTSESNIYGATAQANELSDQYNTLNGSVVYYAALNRKETSYFIGQIGAASSKYIAYTDMDNSSGGASVGLYQQLTQSWSAQLTGRSTMRKTQNIDRDSIGTGGILEIKAQFGATGWIKGTADYEDSNANLSSNDNIANTLGLSMGFLPLQNTFASLGASQNKRVYTLSNYQATSNTIYVDLTQRLSQILFLNVAYAVQDNTNSVNALTAKNNILSAAINLSF